jgi:hypothetical protein
LGVRNERGKENTEGAQSLASFKAGLPIRSLLQGTIAMESFLIWRLIAGLL